MAGDPYPLGHHGGDGTADLVVADLGGVGAQDHDEEAGGEGHVEDTVQCHCVLQAHKGQHGLLQEGCTAWGEDGTGQGSWGTMHRDTRDRDMGTREHGDTGTANHGDIRNGEEVTQRRGDKENGRGTQRHEVTETEGDGYVSTGTWGTGTLGHTDGWAWEYRDIWTRGHRGHRAMRTWGQGMWGEGPREQR